MEDRDLDAHFLQRMSSFEKELLEPIVDRSSLDEFTRRWTTLVDDLQTALQANILRRSTVTIAYSLADRVARMIKTFMDLEALAEQLMASLLDETSSALDSPPSIDPSSVSSVTTLPPYIEPSYNWLLGNIHNPYPSITVRNLIARQSGSAQKDVDNWFKDARKRIGWNAARKDHFANKRAGIVDAATRFFTNDEKLSLSQGAEHALISIMKNAKDLYSDKFHETILATKLAAVIKDLTPETRSEVRAERIRQAQLKRDRDAYPSPHPSPEPIHPLPVSCDDENGTITRCMPIRSRKRRNSSLEPDELDHNGVNRPKKRSRSSAPLSSQEGIAFPPRLPSPALSVGEPSPQIAEIIDTPSSSSSTPVTTSRKRRLSGADGQCTPRHPPVGPRLQTVSDPLPLFSNVLFDATSLDSWFQQVLDHPEFGESSPSGISVELANLTDFVYEMPTESRPASSEFSGRTFEPPTIEVANNPTALDLPWNEFDFDWTGFQPSNNSEKPNSFMNLVGQEPLPKPLTQDLTNFQVSSQSSCPANDFESFFDLSKPSIDPDAILPNTASKETWGFSGSSFNRDDVDLFEKQNVDLQSNNGSLSSFDFPGGTDFLASPNSKFLSTSIPTKAQTRQEKEKEYREACEKAQRLALELQKHDFA